MPHIVEPDTPGAGCINEAVEHARHSVRVWTLTVFPDEQPAACRVSGAEGLLFDVKHGQMPRQGRDREGHPGDTVRIPAPLQMAGPPGRTVGHRDKVLMPQLVQAMSNPRSAHCWSTGVSRAPALRLLTYEASR